MYILSEELERMDGDRSPQEQAISLSMIRKRLFEQYGFEYQSDRWLYTQLHRYENEVGTRLFVKQHDEHDGISKLKLFDRMENFIQKQHINVSQKIKTANGVYDFITMNAANAAARGPIRVLLGAGTTMCQLFSLFLERTPNSTLLVEIFTHNAGCTQLLTPKLLGQDRISVSILGGSLDPVTMTFLGVTKTSLEGIPFDYVVQGTSRICDGRLYIESEKERETKELILHHTKGVKLLALTKYEFASEPPPNSRAYGDITDYDYVVMPRSFPKSLNKPHDKLFLDYTHLFDSEIRNWYYEILKLKRS